MPAPAIRSVRHSSEIGEWELRTREPSPLLSGLVTSICGYVERAPQPFSRREIPSNDVVLILNLGPEISLLDDARARRSSRKLGSFAAGLDDTWSRTEHPGESRGIAVKLAPLAAFRLFGVPLHELSGEVVDLGDLFGAPSATELSERLADLADWEARFALVEVFLARRIFSAPAVAPEVEEAWGRLIASNGTIKVADLVARSGWSHRHLAHRFREHIGMSPKRAARLVRFNHARRRFELDDGSRWAEIALECGYADQPHLNRDFRAFAGAAPAEFIARRLPDGGGFTGD